MDKKVILDYAQELQTNDEPWREFEYKVVNGAWVGCLRCCNPVHNYGDRELEFRRKSKTITVTMPKPERCTAIGMLCGTIHIEFESISDTNTALAAIREAMGNE